MERQPILEKQFKRRYNRDVEIWREIVIQDKKIKQALVKILHNGNEYRIDEFLNDNELTDVAIVTYSGKQYKYPQYLQAEVHVADCLGE